MRGVIYVVIIACALAVTSSCTKFDTAGIIKDRRIIAIVAEPPELTKATLPMSGNLGVTAIVVEPGSPGATLSYEWGYCQVAPTAGPNPAGGGGGGPGGGGAVTSARCDDTDYQLVSSGASSSLPLTAVIAIPATLTAALNAGTALLVPEIRVQFNVDDNGTGLYATKRIAVSTTNLTPNHNPTLDAIEIEGVVAPTMPTTMNFTYSNCSEAKRVTLDDGSKKRVCAYDIAPTVSGMEDYTEYNRITGQMDARREQYTFAWYADAGSFKSETTTQPDPRLLRPINEGVATEWREPADKPTTPVNIWLVVRDGRGGVAWTQRQINLQ
ncbi:MAG: hypothetical protein OEW08_00290 [Gammaproteobacteria bacterium]|nr:hypothetical protein [Gammaproteobacteria bacterium]